VAINDYLRLKSADQHLHPVGRLELFSDAILAIAATLLVLALTVPEHIGGGGLRHLLYAQRWTAVAIVIGFFEIASSWLMSRRLSRITEQVDHWVTLIWLAAVFMSTLIPFTTLLLARSFNRSDFGVAVLCLSAVTWLALVFTTWTVLYVRHAGLLRPEAEAIYRPYLAIILLADVIWTVNLALSLFAPWVAFSVAVVGYAVGLAPLNTEGRDAPSDAAIDVDAVDG
jgi:uncharacterized membrane protein